MVFDYKKNERVLCKTNCRCAMCGTENNLIHAYFIPSWTRVPKEIDNIIPLCFNCNIKRGLNFIEIGKLKYLTEISLQETMRYYKKLDSYLYKYVALYGKQRTRGLINVDNNLLILNSYLLWCREHKSELDWENK